MTKEEVLRTEMELRLRSMISQSPSLLKKPNERNNWKWKLFIHSKTTLNRDIRQQKQNIVNTTGLGTRSNWWRRYQNIRRKYTTSITVRMIFCFGFGLHFCFCEKHDFLTLKQNEIFFLSKLWLLAYIKIKRIGTRINASTHFQNKTNNQ